MNTDNFFPSEDYKIPSVSNYMKFAEGENTFRVLSSAIVGYEYWTTANKPVRSKDAFNGIPEDIKLVKNDRGETVPSQISHFWAFIVWNIDLKKIQILEVKQKGVMQTMQTYIKNPKWGNPREYDFIVTRSGSGFDTDYATTVNPKAPVDERATEMLKKTKVDLELLYQGADPFNPEK